MKKLVLCLLAVPVFLPLSASGQKQSAIGKPFTVSGKVSSDGNSLMPANGESWSVVNPAALAGHEGQLVKVKCRISSAAHDIRVIAVKLVATQVSYHANSGDSGVLLLAQNALHIR